MNEPKSPTTTMLRNLILQKGRVVGEGRFLDVSSFLNHCVDTTLMKEIGAFFADIFRDSDPTLVLTLESSGICPALATAWALGIPLVFAKKQMPITLEGSEVYQETSYSATKGGGTDVTIAKNVLPPSARILVIDDFLASGRTIWALLSIIERQAQANIVGVGVVIEKSFQGGRVFLERFYPELQIVAVASIKHLGLGGNIIFE